MKRLISTTCFLLFALVVRGQDCQPGYEVRNVKCGGKIVSKCVPVNLTCYRCWAVENPPCPGYKVGGLWFYSSYQKAYEVAQRDAATKSKDCIGPNPRIFTIYLDDGGQCSLNPPTPPKTTGTASPPPPKKDPGKAPAHNQQSESVFTNSPQPSAQDQEIARQEEQDRLDNLRRAEEERQAAIRAEEERQAAMRQNNVNNLVEGLTSANNSLARDGDQLRGELQPGGAVTPGQAIRFNAAPGSGVVASVTHAVNMDELEEGSSFTPVQKTGIAIAKGFVKDPLDPMLDPHYFIAHNIKVLAESNQYTKFVSRVPTESLVSGYKYSTRAWQTGQAMLKGDGGEAITKILTSEMVFTNRTLGEYVSNNAKVIARSYDRAAEMSNANSIDNLLDEDNPYSCVNSGEAFDNYHRAYGAMMLNTITPVRAGFIVYEEGRQLPQRVANSPVGQQTTRIARYTRARYRRIRRNYTFERTSDDATD